MCWHLRSSSRGERRSLISNCAKELKSMPCAAFKMSWKATTAVVNTTRKTVSPAVFSSIPARKRTIITISLIVTTDRGQRAKMKVAQKRKKMNMTSTTPTTTSSRMIPIPTKSPLTPTPPQTLSQFPKFWMEKMIKFRGAFLHHKLR